MSKIRGHSRQRQVSGSTISHQRNSQGTGLERVFNRFGLNEETAQKFMDGDFSIPGLRPHEAPALRESLERLGIHRTNG